MPGLRSKVEDLILRVVIGWGPRYASALRKRWAKLRNPKADISFGPGTYAGRGFSIHAPWGGTFHCGRGCEFRHGFRAELEGPQSSIEIGNGCVFTYYSLVQCGRSIQIGDRGVFGQSSMLVDGNHRFRDLTKPVVDQGYDFRPIRIEDDVSTMTKCTIIADIGTRAFVGANSVVSRDIPAYTVAVGAPAKVVDYFGPPGMEPEGWEPQASGVDARPSSGG
jgi:acetyltransferase-like isoleucine patch superfamily enzyme